jgi:hypothetical protein
MCSYTFCLVLLLAVVVLAEPVAGEVTEQTLTLDAPLCRLTRSAARQAEREAENIAPRRNEEVPTATDSDARFAPLPEDSSLTGASNSPADRKLFESLLIDWLFFEDLAPEQRALILRLLARCGVVSGRPSLPASVFGRFNASQRATFVGITHALLNTHLLDDRDGNELGDALQLIEELLEIKGENSLLPSDQQFQLVVRLIPGAAQKLVRARHFQKGENHFFHKEYPVSFRQFRQIGLHGKEAGLHICLTRDGRFAEIHIDYRFGLLHLGPANSDVRAQGNHQRHVDRWPEFGFVVRRVQVRRVVL